jgi:hypothetical protein
VAARAGTQPTRTLRDVQANGAIDVGLLISVAAWRSAFRTWHKYLSSNQSISRSFTQRLEVFVSRIDPKHNKIYKKNIIIH